MTTPALFSRACVKPRLWLLLGMLAGVRLAAAQGLPADSVQDPARQLARYAARAPQEKLFVHLDRPLYLSGETMWLKVYVADGTLGRPLALSGVAYVELLDAANRPVLQGKVALQNATGQGSFVLPAALASGNYTLRAYTSWMQNFGPEAYFHLPVTVLNTAVASGPAAGLAPDSTAVDAQFFPEGGNLVQGLRSRVAFKVTAPTGRGLAATGRVLNAAGQAVASFQTLRRGMGSFWLTPTAGQGPYTAVLTIAGRRGTTTRQLPPAQERGYVLHLAEAADPTQVVLSLSTTATQPEAVTLLGYAGQQAVLDTRLQLLNGHAEFRVNKSQLPGGVSRFTLFNSRQQPVCERLYFQPPAHPLALSAHTDKAAYALRDQVQVQVAATGPAPASLSMAVYRLDSLNRTAALTIDQYLGLTSELHGAVEDPAYYFSARGPEAGAAIDNLLLTQGWRRFRWEDILASSPEPLAYLPEPYGPVVRARLTQAGTAQPRPNVLTYLAAPSRIIRLSNSLSDASGLVSFELPQPYGPQRLVLQTDPRQDSTSQLTLLSPFSARYAPGLAQPFQLMPRFQSAYAQRHLLRQLQQGYGTSAAGHVPPLPTDSLAFYGKPSETYLLDKYTRFKVLEEVLREYVPSVLVKIRKDGYHLMVVDESYKTLVLLKENPLVLLDGVPLFNINKAMAISPLKLQKLEVVASRYFHGLGLYDGLVSFTSYQGDLAGVQLGPRVLVQPYEGLQPTREFYAPRYESAQAKQQRLPDLRTLLYWNPAVTATASGQPLSFYTGDQPGHYLVVLQGLAADGQAGSTHLTFEVKPTL